MNLKKDLFSLHELDDKVISMSFKTDDARIG